MVLMYNGNPEIVAYVRSNLKFMICLRRDSYFFSLKRLIFLHACATCSELPFDISTINKTASKVKFQNIYIGVNTWKSVSGTSASPSGAPGAPPPDRLPVRGNGIRDCRFTGACNCTFGSDFFKIRLVNDIIGSDLLKKYINKFIS